MMHVPMRFSDVNEAILCARAVQMRDSKPRDGEADAAAAGRRFVAGVMSPQNGIGSPEETKAAATAPDNSIIFMPPLYAKIAGTARCPFGHYRHKADFLL